MKHRFASFLVPTFQYMMFRQKENNRAGSICSIAYYNITTVYSEMQWTLHGQLMDTSWTPDGQFMDSCTSFHNNEMVYWSSIVLGGCASNVCATTPRVAGFVAKENNRAENFLLDCLS